MIVLMIAVKRYISKCDSLNEPPTVREQCCDR